MDVIFFFFLREQTNNQNLRSVDFDDGQMISWRVWEKLISLTVYMIMANLFKVDGSLFKSYGL